METHMSHGGARHSARYVQDTGRQTTLRRYTEAREGISLVLTRDPEGFMPQTKTVKTETRKQKKLQQ